MSKFLKIKKTAIVLMLSVALCAVFLPLDDIYHRIKLKTSHNGQEIPYFQSYQPEVLNTQNNGYFFIDKVFIKFPEPQITTSQVLGHGYKEVIECESNWRHYDEHGNILKGDEWYKYNAYGIAQFQIRTFNWLKEKAGKPELCWTRKDDQIWLLRWAIDNNYGYLWTCYQR